MVAGLLFAENAVALSVYQADPTLSAWVSTVVPDVAWHAMLALNLLEGAALALVAFD